MTEIIISSTAGMLIGLGEFGDGMARQTTAFLQDRTMSNQLGVVALNIPRGNMQTRKIRGFSNFIKKICSPK